LDVMRNQQHVNALGLICHTYNVLPGLPTYYSMSAFVGK
jgi:hypothetical protein